MTAYETAADEARHAYRRVREERDELSAQLGAVYTERARLVAFLAACYSAVHVPDRDDDEYEIVYVTTPAGQMSWHVRADDLALFAQPAFVTGTVEWDGHTTEAKYERLAEMADRIARAGGFAGLIASMAKPGYKEAHPLVAERDQAREQLAVARERLESLAAGMELSAATTSPSKKSQIERECAEAVRDIARSIGGES
jgi:hypothetical protein